MPKTRTPDLDRHLLDSGWVDADHTMKSLRISRPTFHQWKKDDELPPHIWVAKPGRKIWFNPAHINEYLDEIHRRDKKRGGAKSPYNAAGGDLRRRAAEYAARAVPAEACPPPFTHDGPVFTPSHPGVMFRPSSPKPTSRNSSAQLAQELL